MRWNPRWFWLAAALLGGVACDQSKAELEQTKGQLQAVTAEREALKSQVAALQTQVSALQQQLQQASAREQTPAQPTATEPGTRHRSADGSRKQESPVTEQQKAEQQKAAEQQMTGRSSMNN